MRLGGTDLAAYTRRLPVPPLVPGLFPYSKHSPPRFVMQLLPSSSSSVLSTLSVLVAALGLTLGLVGCDGDSSIAGSSAEDGASPVSVSFTAGTAASAAKSSTGQRTIADAEGNTLRFDHVELVLREIEFEKAEGAEGCSSADDGADKDGCEEVESGPVLVSLPLGANTPSVVVDTTLPVGTWEEAEFEVHKLDPDDPEDSAFLQESDVPPYVSIRASGAYTPAGDSAQAFTFASDLNAEREIEFAPPIEVAMNASKNITFAVNINQWFRQGDSTLVSPAQAGDDGPFEDLVEQNIERSIEGFEDDDRDGENDEREDENEEDDEEDDEEGEEEDEDEDENEDGDDD